MSDLHEILVCKPYPDSVTRLVYLYVSDSPCLWGKLQVPADADQAQVGQALYEMRLAMCKDGSIGYPLSYGKVTCRDGFPE